MGRIHLTASDPIAESVRQFGAFQRRAARAAREGTIWDGDGVAAAWVNSLLAFSNSTYLTRRVSDRADLEARVAMALEFAAGVDLPWLLDLCLDWIPEDVARELEVILARFGLEPATRMTGMVAGALRPSSRPLPRLRFERITSPAQRLLASDLQSLAYDLPLDTCRMATESGAFWSEPESEFAYLGFDGDTAVTTATTIPLDGRLYAALVATHPEAQRRGYAEAVLRHSLAEARAATDLTPVDLHSSRAGFGVYSAMGFQPVATFAAFAPRG